MQMPSLGVGTTGTTYALPCIAHARRTAVHPRPHTRCGSWHCSPLVRSLPKDRSPCGETSKMYELHSRILAIGDIVASFIHAPSAQSGTHEYVVRSRPIPHQGIGSCNSQMSRPTDHTNQRVGRMTPSLPSTAERPLPRGMPCRESQAFLASSSVVAAGTP